MDLKLSQLLVHNRMLNHNEPVFCWLRLPDRRPLVTWCRCGGPGRVGRPLDSGSSRPDPSGTECGCPVRRCLTGRPADRGPGTACLHSGRSVWSETWKRISLII